MVMLISPKEFTEKILESLGYRVYLSNTGRERKKHPVKKDLHIVDWVAFFVPPDYSIDDCKTWVPMHSWSIERLIQWSKTTENRQLADGLVNEAIRSFAGKVPDSTSLQEAYEGRLKGVMKPDDIVAQIKRLVDKWFPVATFNEITAPQAKYKNKFMEAPVHVRLPVRVIAALVCAAFACEEANRGDMWYRNFRGYKGKPKIAGCLMALGVYLYRRYTNASIDQIATVLRIPTWE
jgi:hypothetical protein